MVKLAPLKKKALIASGTLNPHPEAVVAELFQLEFFDPHDRAQVKYEMLRAHSVDEETIRAVCQQFGFSRESFYQIRQTFHEHGMSALLPRKRGRKGPIKLKGELLDYALEQKRQHPDLDPGQLAKLIGERFGVPVHRTTVMRGVKKKLRSPGARGKKGVRRRR